MGNKFEFKFVKFQFNFASLDINSVHPSDINGTFSTLSSKKVKHYVYPVLKRWHVIDLQELTLYYNDKLTLGVNLEQGINEMTDQHNKR